MRSSIHNSGVRARICAAAMVLLVGIALPSFAGTTRQGGVFTSGSASSGSAQGKGMLEAKDSNRMTLDLDGVRLQVNDDTLIFDGDKKRMAFAAIPEPDVTPTLVTWSGTRTGRDGVLATRLVVEVPPK